MWIRKEILKPSVGDVVIADIGASVYRRIRVSTVRGGLTFDGRIINADDHLADQMQNLPVHQIVYVYPRTQQP